MEERRYFISAYIRLMQASKDVFTYNICKLISDADVNVKSSNYKKRTAIFDYKKHLFDECF